MLTPLGALPQLLLAILVTLAAYTDLRTRRIPNLLVAPAALIGFVTQFAAGGLSGLRSAAFGLGVGFLLYFPLWLLRARGAGDVKLLAAAGAFLGPADTVVLFCIAAITGGVVALLLVLLKDRTRETAGSITRILSDLLRLRRPEPDVRDASRLRLPHAPVIAVSVYLILAMLYISQTHMPSR